MYHSQSELPPEDIQIIKYSNAATIAFLVWEACITFPDEADFIWGKARVRWAKAAHLVLRYYTICVLFIVQITWSQDICDALRLCEMSTCARWLGQSISLQIIIGLQQYLMASRVYALYGGTHSARWLLVLAFAAEHLVMAVCTAASVGGTTLTALCAPVQMPPVGIGVGLAPIVYDALLLVLTVRRCTRGLGRRAPLLELLFRDGLWAFLVIFGTFVLQAMFFGIIRGPLASAAWSWQFAACSFTAGRVVLHMYREAGALPPNRTHADVSTEVFALTTVAPEPGRGSEEW